MEEPSRQTAYIRNPEVVLREEDDSGALLFDPETSEIVVLNPTGLFIWNKCDGLHEFGEIVAALREDFEPVPDEAGDAVQAFLDELVSSRFLVVVEPRTASVQR